MRCVRGAVSDPSLVFVALADPERLRLWQHLASGSQRRSIAALSMQLGWSPRHVRLLLRGLHRAGVIDENAGGTVRAPALDTTLHAVWAELVLACCNDQGVHANAQISS